MNIFFINYDRYSGCSGVHTHFLANALVQRGHRCFVTVPVTDNENDYFGNQLYSFLSVEDISQLAEQQSPVFEGAVLHAWTPREFPRLLTMQLAAWTGLPYFVHLEDNEHYILEKVYNSTFEDLEAQSLAGSLDINPSYSHPLLHQTFLEGAAGVTCIIETLKRFVPDAVPSLVFWPACEDTFLRLPLAPNQKVRQQLGIRPDEIVLTYPGNFHLTNSHVMRELYLSLNLLAEWGQPVRLIRAGVEYDKGMPSEVRAARDRYVIHAGNVSATALPALVGAANILVQPGEPGPFDDCRFPSKLPFFLASGRPVITSTANLGKHLRNEEECLFLTDSSAEDIACRILRLIQDPALAAHIGAKGREFARKSLSWDKSAARVEAFYKKILHIS